MYLTRQAAEALAKTYPDITWKYDDERELMRVSIGQVHWELLVAVRNVGESETALVMRIFNGT